MMDRMFVSGVYAALIVLVVFLYVRMRRLEGHLHAVDATLDTVLAETPPSEFLPSFERRIAALEALGKTRAAEQRAKATADPGESVSESDSDSDSDSDDDAVADAQGGAPTTPSA